MSTTPGPINPAPIDSGAAGTVARGSFWMILNAAVQRGASFGAQIILGWLLSDHDFGLYALAISIHSLTGALRDGGVRQLLIQRHADYEHLVGPLFWMALALNTLTALALVGVAPLAARGFDEPALVSLLLVIALAQPLATPGAILSARLSIDLRFREAARIMTVSSLVRYFGVIALAIAGFGPMSFVLPLPVLAIVEWAMGYAYTRERPWRLQAAVCTWWGMLLQTRWIFVGTFATAAINLGAGIAVKPFVATEVIGMYYFAFLIIVQIGMLLSANVMQVFFPAFARMSGDSVRISMAAARALRQLMLIAAPMCLGLAATFGPLELLIWRGKWAAAAEAVQVIALLYPAVIATSVPLVLQQAAGRFRAWALTLLAIGLASLLASAAGAAAWGTALGIAVATSAGTGAVAIVVTFATLRSVEVLWTSIFRALFSAWFISCIAAGASVVLDQLLADETHPVLRVGASGVVFCAIFGTLARLILPDHVREALAVIPARVRNPMTRLLRIASGGAGRTWGTEADSDR